MQMPPLPGQFLTCSGEIVSFAVAGFDFSSPLISFLYVFQSLRRKCLARKGVLDETFAGTVRQPFPAPLSAGAAGAHHMVAPTDIDALIILVGLQIIDILLLVAKRDHGIHLGGSSRRDVACEESNSREQD